MSSQESGFNNSQTKETIRFRCRSPIFMCYSCSKAKNCPDLIQLLREYTLEEIDDKNLRDKFPFNIIDRKIPENDKNKLNELQSGEWIKFTKTLVKSYTDKAIGYKIHRKHPYYRGIYIFGELISFFTKQGEVILDPCAGTGASLLAATFLNREAIGFEIEKDWITKYYNLCSSEGIKPKTFAHGDCFELIKFIPKNSVDYVIFDPPHIGEFKGKKSESFKLNLEALETENFKENKNIDFIAYLSQLKILIKHFYRILKHDKYFSIFTKCFYFNKEYKIISGDINYIAKKEGFILKGEKIWHDRREKIRPYGYPYHYIPNVTHYNILIFKKGS